MNGYYFFFDGDNPPCVSLIVDSFIYLHDLPYMSVEEYESDENRFIVGPIINTDVLQEYLI